MHDEYFLVNAYAPYENSTIESHNQYISFLSGLNDMIDEQSCPNVVIAGGFNADPKGGRFGTNCSFSAKIIYLILRI